MKILVAAACLISLFVNAQPQPAQIVRGTISPFSTSMPSMLPERFIDITKAWAYAYTRPESGYDATNVSDNSITISAMKRNAFRYQNTGDVVENKIRYSLIISFTSNSYTVKFVVNEIYGDNDVLLKYKLPDYYKSDGSL